MTEIIELKSTSTCTTDATPIILRDNQLTRLIFQPKLIKTRHANPEAFIEGTFVFQRKGKNDLWENISEESLAKLKKGEGYQLRLDRTELHKLLEKISETKAVYEQHGYHVWRKKLY